MNGRVLPFDSSAHAAADTLLPFFANGTLRGEELAFVEEHVRECEACQREVDWLHSIYLACAAGLAASDAEAPPVSAGGPAPQLQSGRGKAFRASWRSIPQWAQWALAAQLAAIVVLGAVSAMGVHEDASFRTLGATSSSAQLADAVAVVFDPGITEAEMRRVVQEARGRIVDGPSSTDVFVLEVPSEQTAQALAVLHAQRSVLLAERLGPRTSR